MLTGWIQRFYPHDPSQPISDLSASGKLEPVPCYLIKYGSCNAEDGIFISFADLQPYTSQDQAYTKQLRDWFSKQFDVVSI
jgi:hypothetical protein